VKIRTPRREKRIATTFRGIGPRGLIEHKDQGLDSYLLQSALAMGARHIRNRVDQVRWLTEPNTTNTQARLIQIKTQGGEFQSYELLAVTTGVNTSVLKLFRDLDFGYQPPRTSKLLVREYYLGEEAVSRFLGSIFHAFLLDIPGLDYGAIIPKGAYMTICLLSSHGDLDSGVMEIFLNDPIVKSTLPPDFSSARFTCNCSPRINFVGGEHPFGNRIVFVGDCGVSRLYKDGIGAAYRTAKIAARTAVFQGISADDFEKHYLPFLHKIEYDNLIGKSLFKCVSQINKTQFIGRAVLRMVSNEQQMQAKNEHSLSTLIWDMLTGGAPYRDVLIHALHPLLWTRLLWNILVSLILGNGNRMGSDSTALTSQPDESHPLRTETKSTKLGNLGRIYRDRDIIVRQGDIGECMFVIQDGCVEVLIESAGQQVQLDVLGQNEFFGEMALFENEVRMATVRALGIARVMTIDKKNLLRRIHEDPSLAYRLIQVMSGRVRHLGKEVSQLRHIP
jgi:flavin-dependent dehydrogenase